jgi:hypothetical protein
VERKHLPLASLEALVLLDDERVPIPVGQNPAGVRKGFEDFVLVRILRDLMQGNIANRNAAENRVHLRHIQMVGDEIVSLWDPVLLVANGL